ncbi:MAG: ribbon-helix-helix domain-containing protein [Rhodospirillaceae bacterium]|nr:ribbon-helix-helix domain-containing protein [Rhodospirillaceae bacterium]
MTARVEKRSVTIRGHRTSVSLEAPFWEALKEKAAAEGRSLGSLIAEVDEAADGNLSSALRLHVVTWMRARLRD